MAKVKLLDPSDPRRKLDRYELIGEIATGGMATVFLARRGGVGGFQRFTAIKRLHPHLANEPEFVEMFLDEARLAALIHHPNVVPILEVGETEAGYYLVMEYIEGDTLSRIVARTMSLGQMPPRHVILRILLDTLAGLHAAHELRDDRGQLLGLVHRDCSPQNLLVGVDGSARITDFGVARASSRLTSTAHGKLKGKLAYMAPEQTRGDELDRRTDLFAMGIITWEVLCGKRLFKADSEAATLQRILVEPIRPPSEVNPQVPKVFDAVVLRALDRNQDRRYQTAADYADALENAAREAARASVTDVGVASPREVASFVQQVLGQEIGAQRESVRAWLAQSDSGQEIVIGAGPARPLPVADNVVGAMRTGGSSPPGAVQQGPTALTPAQVGGAKSNVQSVPQFEVAADVTMRFALEQPKADPPPPPSTPPPRPAGPPSSSPPPRPPPPPKPSTPTLLGQGPAPSRDANGAPLNAPRPGSGPMTLQAKTVKEGAVARSDARSEEDGAVAMRGAQLSDDLGEDAVTVARPNTAPPPSAMVPQVKTQRGLFAENLLADARAKAEANGGYAANGASNSGNVSVGMPTPRMPMPADRQLADASPSAPPPVMEANPLSPSRHPRTLVSATTGEVSAGGFTPGSMTLPSDASLGHSLHNETLDPTVIHSVPKRSVGKYVVVLAAFMLVFGTGLILLRSSSDTTKPDNKGREATSEKKSEPKEEPTARSTATSLATTTSSAGSTATASASSTASAIDTAAPHHTTTHSPRDPKPDATTKATAKPDATTKPDATAKPDTTVKKPDEDLANPYK